MIARGKSRLITLVGAPANISLANFSYIVAAATEPAPVPANPSLIGRVGPL